MRWLEFPSPSQSLSKAPSFLGLHPMIRVPPTPLENSILLAETDFSLAYQLACVI